MKQLLTKTGLLCIAIFLIIGCKKYPDGPLLDFHSKEKRLASGPWNVDYFEINGNDSTAYLKSLHYYGTYNFEKEDKGEAGFFYNNGIDYGTSGRWYFTNHKKQLVISHTSYVSSYNFSIGAFAAQNATWEIRRMTMTELWLKCIYSDGREYFVKFKH